MGDPVIPRICPDPSHDTTGLDLRYVEYVPCYLHREAEVGSEDAVVTIAALPSGLTDGADGSDNRAFAKWMRKTRRERGK